jgi:hypothetical protein
VHVNPAAGTSAWDMADLLAEDEPAVIVRDDEVARGFFELDPCNLSDDEAVEVAERILAVLARTKARLRRTLSFADWTAKRRAKRLAWPD